MRVDPPAAAMAALTLAAATGLHHTLTPPAGPVDDDTWRSVVAGAQRHRLAGHLAHAITSGTLPATPTQVDAAADLDLAWQRNAVLMERLLLHTVHLLDASGVSCRVIKGSALAHTVYADPAHRAFGDIDILVPGAALADARRTLVAGLHAEDVLPELRPGFDGEFAKDVLLRLEDRSEIDLHRTLASGPFGLRIPVAELFDHPATFTVGDRELLTLGPVPTLVQVCYNAALGDVPPRLASLRDVAQVYLTFQPAVDDIVATADRWGGTAVVARAVQLAWSSLALEPCELSAWAETHRPGPLDRRLLAASTSESRSYARSLAAVAAIRGPRAKARYLRAIVMPGPDYLAARGWTRRTHLTRALRSLRSLRLRPRRQEQADT